MQTAEAKCSYGSDLPDGQASRECNESEMWLDFNATECITRITYRFRQLAVVRMCVHKMYLLITRSFAFEHQKTIVYVLVQYSCLLR